MLAIGNTKTDKLGVGGENMRTGKWAIAQTKGRLAGTEFSNH